MMAEPPIVDLVIFLLLCAFALFGVMVMVEGICRRWERRLKNRKTPSTSAGIDFELDGALMQGDPQPADFNAVEEIKRLESLLSI